ncbi:hypothetical protein GCM10027578_21850 [Spirosoma luteolum]
MPDYPFRFEKAPKKKGICPQCGHHDKFRYYEDLAGNRLDDFGKCERKNECGYWLVPTGKVIPKAEGTYTPPPEPATILPAGDLLDRINQTLVDPESTFHAYCISIGITYEHLARWRVGAETKAKKTLTVFVHCDSQNRITNAKWFLYTAEGKRDKSFDSFSLKQPPETQLERYGMSLYGEHLLDPEQLRPVMIVESEKTAVIAAWFYPDLDWIAVGSCSGLTEAKSAALAGRWCYWLCDADKAGRENSSIRRLKEKKLLRSTIDLFPNRHDGTDIADVIRDGQTPELISPHELTLLRAKVETTADEQPETQSDVDDDENVPWENQVGLPMAIWHQKETRKHFRKHGFIEYQNAYYFATKREASDDDTWVFKAVSNFIIKPLLLIESKSDPKRIYQITNAYKVSKVIDLDPKQFANVAGFSEVVMSKGNFIFYGTKTHFIKITMKLFEESKEAQEIKTLGYHPDGFYAFSNGIQNSQWVPLDENGYGIVEHNGRRYFLPAMSKIYLSDDQEYQTQKQFILMKSPITFKEYAEKFCTVYGLNGNGRIGLLFYIACLYRDVVFGHFRFFPHLYLFGPPQSGKSSLAWSTMFLFGQPRPPFMLNTGTSVAFYKQFAEFRNAVVWFDEYQNSIDYGRVQSLKTAYDGAGHTKSDNTKDNRNKSIPVSSGCIISGQELPTADAALFTRCILLQFTKTDFTATEREQLERFNNEIEKAGVSHLTAHIAQFRDVFSDRFLKCFDAEFVLIKERFKQRGIDDRITKNMAILLATYQALKDKLEFPFTDDELRQTAYSIIGAQNSLITGSKETATFWKIVVYLYRNRQIKPRLDFKLEFKAWIDLDVPAGQSEQRLSLVDDQHPAGRMILMIRLANVHTLYQKASREVGAKNALDEGSLRHYLVTAKEFKGKVRGVKFGKTSSTALAFDYEYLCETIEDFSLNDLLDDDDTADQGDAPAPDAPTPGRPKTKPTKGPKTNVFGDPESPVPEDAF